MQIATLALALGALTPAGGGQVADLARIEAELTNLEQRIFEMQVEECRLDAQLECYSKYLKSVEEFVEVPVPGVMTPNPHHRQLTAQHKRLSLELLLLVEGTVAASTLERKREAIKAQLQALSREIDETPEMLETVPASVERSPNPAYSGLRERVVVLQAERAGVDAVLTRLVRRKMQLEDQRAKLLGKQDQERPPIALPTPKEARPSPTSPGLEHLLHLLELQERQLHMIQEQIELTHEQIRTLSSTDR